MDELTYSYTKNTMQTIKIGELQPQHNNMDESQKHNVELEKKSVAKQSKLYGSIYRKFKNRQKRYLIDKTMNKSEEIRIRGEWFLTEEAGKDCDWEDECRGFLGSGDVLFLYLLVTTQEFHFSLHVLHFRTKIFLKKKKFLAHCRIH